MKKRITAILLLALIFASMTLVSVSAEVSDTDPTDGGMFRYESGVVRDGSTGDIPGVIGDEKRVDPINGTVDGYWSYNGRKIKPSVPTTVRRSDGTDGSMTDEPENGRVAGATDYNTDNGMTTFLGIVLALVIGAAAILIAILAFPSRRKDRD